MVSWWWIAPGVLALAGTFLVLAGLGSLFRGKLAGALGGVGIGGILLAGGVGAILFGLNLHTYGQLTEEHPVATVRTEQVGPRLYDVTLVEAPTQAFPDGRTLTYPVHGDAWRLEAQILRWKPWATVLGLDTQYRLDRLSGRYDSVEDELNASRSVHGLAPEPRYGVEAWDWARRLRRYAPMVDTLYGGGVYMPMTDGGEYEVWITQSGLIARPVNPAAEAASTEGWTEVD